MLQSWKSQTFHKSYPINILRYFPFLSNKSTDIKSSLEEKTASTRTINYHWMIGRRRLLDLVRILMAYTQKPHFVFRLNGRVHLIRRGSHFSRLLAAEVCASALVMLDTPRSEVVWEYWLPTPFASFPFISPPVRHRVPPHSERSIQIFIQLNTLIKNCLNQSVLEIHVFAFLSCLSVMSLSLGKINHFSLLACPIFR
jgi:hypothetical protein